MKLPFLPLLFLVTAPVLAADVLKVDAQHPFRADSADAVLSAYQPQPCEFPPVRSGRLFQGELVSVDYYLRKGTFRTSDTGKLVEFTMGPYAYVRYLDAEADLREAPIGANYLFVLNQDARGEFTILATMQDLYSFDRGRGSIFRIREVKLQEGCLLALEETKGVPNTGPPEELHVGAGTRVWKGDQQVKLTDLAIGDELLYQTAGRSCTDLYVGKETHQLTTERQRQRFIAYQKKRGLPGWVDKTESHLLTVSLFSGYAETFAKDFLEGWAAGREVSVCVANTELRTWNPPVDKERGSIVEVQSFPRDGYGASGVRLVVRVPYLLEGFRRGHVVRLFGPAWPIKDANYGESLMNYGYARLQAADLLENPAREYPAQFPFRTDFGNAHLPWYQAKAGEAPPPFSEHIVYGELVKADAAARTGQFRIERTGETVEFTLLPKAAMRFLQADVSLAEVPPGTRCRFFMYQDAAGAFTRCSQVNDDFSASAAYGLTWRVKELRLEEGKLHVGKQMAEVKNYNGDMERPPEVGQAAWRVTAETRVWKGDSQIKLTDLAVGDVLLANFTTEQPSARARATDLWVGEETHKLITAQQSRKLTGAKK